MQGKVIRLVAQKGFGFIKGSDQKEYFFHRSALKNVKFEEVSEGQTVEFEESETSNGPRAEDVFVD